MILRNTCKGFFPRLLLISVFYIVFHLYASGQTNDSSRVSAKTNTGKNVVIKTGSLDNTISYNATDSIVFDIQKKKVYLYNNAVIDYGATHLEAYYIEIDLNSKVIYSKGKVDSAGKYASKPVLKDGEDNYVCDSLVYNSLSKKGKVYGLKLVEDDAIVHLQSVKKQADGSFIGDHGKITTCNEEHPHFYFNAQKIKVIPNNKVVFGPANLVVEDVPTPLAVPFGIAPLKKGRRNGLLFPAYGFNGANGAFYLQNLGWYMGLGKYADLTLLSDLYLNGDFRIGATTKFIKRYKYAGNFGVNYSRFFPSGEERQNKNIKYTNSFNVIGGFNFDQKMFPGTNLSGNINVQSGNFNQLNSRDLGQIIQNEFNSNINYSRNFFKNKLNLSASATHRQNTVTRDFEVSLPNVNLGIPSITPFKRAGSNGEKWYEQVRFNYNMTFRNNLKTKDTLLFSERGRDELNKLQNGFNHTLSLNTNFKAFKGILNITPAINYFENWLFKTNYREFDGNLKQNLNKDSSGFWRFSNWNASISTNTNIYGTFEKVNLGKIKAIRHTITPSVGLVYSPEISKFNNSVKFYQDSIGDKGNRRDTLIGESIFKNSYIRPFSQLQSGSISWGIGNNFQGKKAGKYDSTGKYIAGEKVSLVDQLNFSGSYNIAAKKYKFSNVIGTFNTVLFRLVNMNADINLDPYYYDSKGRRTDTLAIVQNNWKKISYFRIQSFGFGLNTAINADMFRKNKKTKKQTHAEDENELRSVSANRNMYLDFDIPWTMRINYNININPTEKTKVRRMLAHNIMLSGDFSLTPEWKVTYRQGYDFRIKEISNAEFGVSRNLHCWQLDFNWIPLGPFRSWTFTLRPKSGLLQDLKLNKRNFSNPYLF